VSESGASVRSGLLSGLRIVELSSFVAAPTCGLTLAQLGADVIRVDPVGGAPDARRWPLANGASMYWAGLNRGKRSVELDLATPAGQETLAELVGLPGQDAGIFVTNVSGKPWLSPGLLRKSRDDLIQVDVLGTPDGGAAVDYTVNAETGLPYATGPASQHLPVNHTLPAWDLLCGLHVAVAVLACLRARSRDGRGHHVTVALRDVALATLTTLGFLPEAHKTGTSRPPLGNFVYGTFATDLPLGDGSRVMVVAITQRQWSALLDATGTARVVAAIERELGADFCDEGTRFEHRELLVSVIKPWFADRTLGQVRDSLSGTHVLWSPFLTFAQALAEGLGAAEPVLTVREEAELGMMLATAGPVRVDGVVQCPAAAPVLGADTRAVLGGLLGR
jgi:2-methylfumaryl-CoA isomerase